MTERQRHHRAPHRGAAALLHSERHREQPAHSGIHTVERAEGE